jgi:regulator of protease activity HflC (stomatin/prohibitin superfamily)
MKKVLAILAMAIAMTGCTRISTGEVGLIVNWDKTIDTREVIAGSVNQTMTHDVLTFPIREINAEVKDLQPQTVENVTMADFDLTVVYNVNPSAVSDLYINKSRSFHGTNAQGETLLMQNYLQTIARNAVMKTVPKYEALKINIQRADVEQEILASIKAELVSEKLDSDILVSKVLVRNAVPPAAITQSANNLVRAQNELKQSAIEVQKAEQESKRIAALNANAGAVTYMQAQAQMKIAEGIAAGRVQTIVVPYDFKGMVNVSK